MTQTLSPDHEVVRCAWFKPERDDGKPTRAQRIVFAVQGGFTDSFLTTELKVNPFHLRKRLVKAADEFSKHVHGRENTLVDDQAAQDAVMQEALDVVASFLDAVRDCRGAVLKPILEKLDEAAVDALMSETLQEIDELATHYSLEEVCVDDISVHAIAADTITYRVSGTVEVVLQWGSNSDVHRGDGAELPQSFPFQCDMQLPLDDPWDLGLAETTYGVDTQEWHDAMAPDDN